MKAAAALLVVVLSFSACEGGCGEAPKDSGAAQGSGQTVSGGSTGGGGGDAIPLTGGQRRQQKADENPLAAPKPETAPIKAAADVAGARVPNAGVSGTAAPAASATAGRVVSAAVMDVSPGDFERLVVRNPKPVLMVYVTSSCRPCSKVEFELASMAQNYEGKVVFGRMDLNQSGATTLLPPGLRRLPLPALAFYQDGSPLNIRQNIPVPSDSSSLLKDWLKRVVDGRDVRLN